MFGLSKKERYEKRVIILLHAFFGDITGVEPETMIAPKIKELYREHWDGVIEEGVSLGNSPEQTAIVLTTIFYKDMFINQISAQETQNIRSYILDKVYENENLPNIIYRILITTLVANGMTGREISTDIFALFLRDIHRAIFDGDDERLNCTVEYFVEGSNQIKEQWRN